MTDMRFEENGWLTFDRKVSKADEERLAAMHGKLNSKPPVQKVLISPSSSWQVSIANNSVPRSEKRDSSLAARLQANPDFNSMKWISGRAPFANRYVSQGSLWDGEKQLFMRKTFNLSSIPENASVRVYTRLEGKGIFWIYSRIFINGKFVADESTRQIMPENRIAEVILPDEAIALLKKGENQITVQFFPGFSSRDAVFGNPTEKVTVDVALTTFEQQ